MKSTDFLLFLGLLALQPEQASAFWRMACSVSQTARADPILNPGGVAGHVHKFAGGNNVNQASTFDSLQSSTCSTCEVQSDKSAYWTPQLYYAHSNGSFEEVQNDGMTVYYVGRGGDASNTKPFPQGFQMISGTSVMRSYDSQTLTYLDTRPVADRVSFRCIDEANDIPEEHYMFDTNCVNGMRAQVNFQSCWDGQNVFLPNSSHVAYLSGIDYGVCPPTHPVPIPGLFYEVLYWTNRVDQSAGGQFVFSNGDTTGYGFHGDFLNGWDMDVQTAAVEDCLYVDNNGVVSACGALAPSDDVNFSRNCLQQPSVFDEPVQGMLDSLPGCNSITSGPEIAPQEICPLNSNFPGQSVAPSSTGATAASTSSAMSSFASSSTVDSFTTSTPNTSAFSSFTLGSILSTSSFNSTGFSFTQDVPSQTTGGVFVQLPSTGNGTTAITFLTTAAPTATLSTITTSIVPTGIVGGVVVTLIVTETVKITIIIGADGQSITQGSTITQPVMPIATAVSALTTSNAGQGSNGTGTGTGSSTMTIFTTITSYVTVYPTITTTLSVPSAGIFATDAALVETTSTTFTVMAPTLDGDSSFATNTFTSSISVLDALAGCSLYSTFFPDGCPTPTDSITSTPTAVGGSPSFVTVTQQFTDDATPTTLPADFLPGRTAFFTLRGREVSNTGRREGWRWWV